MSNRNIAPSRTQQASDQDLQRFLTIHQKVSQELMFPHLRRNALKMIGDTLVYDAQFSPGRENRLGWMETAMTALKETAVEQDDEAGQSYIPAITAIEQLSRLGTDKNIMAVLSPDEKLSYQGEIRDGLAASMVAGWHANIRHKAQNELYCAVHAALSFMPEQSLDYCLPLIKSHVNIADSLLKRTNDGTTNTGPQKTIYETLTHPSIEQKLTGDEYASYVNAGLKAAIHKRDTASGQVKQNWGQIVSNLGADKKIAAVADEAVLKQAGYLDLTGHRKDSLARQLGVMEAFLGTKDDVTREVYVAHMGGCIRHMDKTFIQMKRNLTVITDTQAVQDLVDLQADHALLVSTWQKFVPDIAPA